MPACEPSGAAERSPVFEACYRPRASLMVVLLMLFAAGTAAAVALALTEQGTVVVRGMQTDVSTAAWAFAAFSGLFLLACAAAFASSRGNRLRLTGELLSVDAAYRKPHARIRLRDVVGVREEKTGNKALLVIQMRSGQYVIQKALFPDGDQYQRFAGLLKLHIRPRIR